MSIQAQQTEQEEIVRWTPEWYNYFIFRLGFLRGFSNTIEDSLAILSRFLLLLFLFYCGFQATVWLLHPDSKSLPDWFVLSAFLCQIAGLEGSIPGLAKRSEALKSKGNLKDAGKIDKNIGWSRLLTILTVSEGALHVCGLDPNAMKIISAVMLVVRGFVITGFIIELAKTHDNAPRIVTKSEHQQRGKQVQKVNDLIETLTARVNAFSSNVNENEERLLTQVNAQVNALEAKFDALVNAQVNALQTEMSTQVNAKVNALESRVITQVNVYQESVGGQIAPVVNVDQQEEINELHQLLKKMATQINEEFNAIRKDFANEIDGTTQKVDALSHNLKGVATTISEVKEQTSRALLDGPKTPTKTKTTTALPTVPNTPRPTVKPTSTTSVEPDEIPTLSVEGIADDVIRRVLIEHLIGGKAWGRCTGNYPKTIQPVMVAYNAYIEQKNAVNGVEVNTGELIAVGR